MNTRRVGTASLLAALVGMLGMPVASRAQGQAACQAGTDAAEQACFASWAAEGRYQEIVDDIMSRKIDLKPHQRYFLGIAYFALAGRTGASSLRCAFLGQAKSHLENFLEGRQKEYASTQGFGSAEEMKYTYVAARVLESARGTSGCDESADSLGALERHGKRYLSGAVEGLFFDYGTAGAKNTAARKPFEDRMNNLRSTVRTFVSNVSRMETNYSLYQTELTVAYKDLATIEKTANEWRPAAVSSSRDELTGDLTYAIGKPMDELASDIRGLIEEYKSYFAPGGPLKDTVDAVDKLLAAAGVNSMEDYDRQRTATVKAAQGLSDQFARVYNQALLFDDSEGVKQLLAPPPTKAEGVEDHWRAIEQGWKTKKPACAAAINANKWYCK